MCKIAVQFNGLAKIAYRTKNLILNIIFQNHFYSKAKIEQNMKNQNKFF